MLFAAAPTQAAGNPCKPSQSGQIRHTLNSYVFKLRKRGISPFGETKRSGIYACNALAGRWYPLARNSRWEVDRAYVNGNYVAFTIAEKPIEPGSGHGWRLRVMNTLSGRIVHELDFTYGTFISDFAVGRSGSLAYISYGLRGGDWHYWVKRRDWRGVTVLDKGHTIGEQSLHRSWYRISWSHGSGRKSDTLF